MSRLIGTVVDTVSFEIERGKINEFVRATATEDLAHTDSEAAQRAGAPDVLATATHVVVAGHQRDQAGFVRRLGLDLARVVVGNVDWQFERALHAGDRLVGTRVVTADDTREARGGGTMRFVTLETEYRDTADEVPVRVREVLVERSAR